MSKEVIVKLTSDHIKVKGAKYVRDLVRCKDCKEYDEWLDGKICMRLGSYYGDTEPDDFCSYGEVRDE